MMGSSTTGTRAELFVRSLAPREAQRLQDSVMEQLERLDEQGALDEYRIQVTGHRVPSSPSKVNTKLGMELLDRIDTFQKWADQQGFSIGSLFERHTLESQFTGETTDAITMPVMVLAEYEDGRLRFVSPVTNQETTWTVRDRLQVLVAEHENEDIDHLEQTTEESDSPQTPDL